MPGEPAEPPGQRDLRGGKPPNIWTVSDVLSRSEVQQQNVRTDLLLRNLLLVEYTLKDGVAMCPPYDVLVPHERSSYNTCSPW